MAYEEKIRWRKEKIASQWGKLNQKLSLWVINSKKFHGKALLLRDPCIRWGPYCVPYLVTAPPGVICYRHSPHFFFENKIGKKVF